VHLVLLVPVLLTFSLPTASFACIYAAAHFAHALAHMMLAPHNIQSVQWLGAGTCPTYAYREEQTSGA
jgi:hypothetical protein